MKKNAVTQQDKQKFIDKLNKVINQLRDCNDTKCVQNTHNDFIKNLNGKDQDVLGGSFNKLTADLECISKSKVDRINLGAKIQVNIDNIKSLNEAIAKCNGNASCINNFKKKINEIHKESKKFGKEVKDVTKKILDCCNSLNNLIKKLFHIKDFTKKLIKYHKKSLRKTKRKIKNIYLFKKKLKSNKG